MQSILDFISNLAAAFPRITITNIFEMFIIAFIVYEVLLWIKNSRAWVLLRGICIILIFTMFCIIFQLDTILWILGKVTTIAAIALIMIFQPELRRALEHLGSQSMWKNLIPSFSDENTGSFTDEIASEIIHAAFDLSKTKTGALMVIERSTSLKEIERTGIVIDGVVTSQLLINIFEHNTPLHDGAVIIRGDKIAAATCYLPLSENMFISKAYGTRHRAALGISESSDAITVVVSEETGGVSVAEAGNLTRVSDEAELRRILSRLKTEEESGSKQFRFWKGRGKDERKAD